MWLGWRDSNPRMTGPEPVALPLGDTPKSREILEFIENLGKFFIFPNLKI